MADPIRVLLSQTTFNTDGVTTVWNFSFSGGYLDQTHVKAQLRNTATGAVTAITLAPAMFTGPYQLTLSPALAVGQELTIYRATPKEGPLVDFTDRAKLTEVSLDYSAKQAVFGVAEADDWRMVVSAAIAAIDVYQAAIATGPVASVNGRTGSVVLVSSDVGLANVDNTSDANKLAEFAPVLAPPGKISYFMRSTAPSGWIKANGFTIGNASSGATGRANADTSALFTLLWAEFSNTLLPIQDSTGAASSRGASAAVDYAANKRLPLFDLRAEFIRGADDSRGIDTARVLGSSQAQSIEAHTHTTPASVNNPTGGTIQYGGTGQLNGIPTTVTGSYGGTETRPRNVAFLACVKL